MTDKQTRHQELVQRITSLLCEGGGGGGGLGESTRR